MLLMSFTEIVFLIYLGFYCHYYWETWYIKEINKRKNRTKKYKLYRSLSCIFSNAKL